MKEFQKEAVILIAIVIGCAVVARYANRGMTLEEYAQKNPETAYGTVSGNDVSGN